MSTEPICPLCSCAVVREENVSVSPYWIDPTVYSLAWVCKNCGACWPIAVAQTGLVKRRSHQMWHEGNREK